MTDSNARVVLQAKGLNKTYREASQTICVLDGVDLSVTAGQMAAVVGASGSGKSTLLHCLGLLDQPDDGDVVVDGQATTGLSETRRSRIRNRSLGFVYQFHHLLAEFSALDNVAMPLIVRRTKLASARERARSLLEQVGLANRDQHYPGQLSGGERQRVALARALVTEPACVLADEPTGNLDQETAASMFALLQRINNEAGTAFVIVTHDNKLASMAHVQYAMDNGRLTC